MPKRPCAIALTSDNDTIICGDKFGDVYSVPLLGTHYERGLAEGEQPASHIDGDTEISKAKPFAPAASSLTVHTKRNREALRNQQRQVKQKSEKEVLKFDHELLLGHVSLLTDLITVRLPPASSPSGVAREYIITADRDEHIRVSRGIPQSHLIEGYCLGHSDFVSAMCVPEQHPQLLLSGGGDGDLLVWDWLSGTLRQRLSLRYHVSQMHLPDGANIEEDSNIAVSGIWTLGNRKLPTSNIDVVVTCEAYVPPAIQ